MSRSRGRFARSLEVTLLLLGLAGVAAWLVSVEIATLAQSWDNFVFERQTRGEAASVTEFVKEQNQQIMARVRSWVGSPTAPTPPKPPVVANVPPAAAPRIPEINELIGRLSIPRLNLLTTVREGTGDKTLALATGHIRGTTFPGQNGNVGVAGHRDTFFRGLSGIKVKDMIEFETMDSKYVYQVDSTNIVKPDNVGVLKAGRYPELTLVTCYPFNYVGSAPERFIVKARQVSQSPLHSTLLTSVAPVAPGKTAATSAVDAPVAGVTSASPSTADVPAAGVKVVESVVPPSAAKAAPAPSPRDRIGFQVARRRSQQLAPGISFGVTDVDKIAKRVDGWIWVMPDRQTVWVRDQKLQSPVIFYQEGEMRELTIASVSETSASGYLVLHPDETKNSRSQTASAGSFRP
jgi:sortase A